MYDGSIAATLRFVCGSLGITTGMVEPFDQEWLFSSTFQDHGTNFGKGETKMSLPRSMCKLHVQIPESHHLARHTHAPETTSRYPLASYNANAYYSRLGAYILDSVRNEMRIKWD